MNKNSVVATFCAGFLAVSGLAMAECERPQAPVFPDGSTASKREMSQAQTEMKNYMKAGRLYLKCVKSEQLPVNDNDPAVVQNENQRINEELNADYKSMRKELIAVNQAFSATLSSWTP